jgi:hypothetical protein
VAARLREELGIPVEQRSGAYGEFTVLIDDQVVFSGGRAVWLGVMPPEDEVLRAVRSRLSA